MILLAEARDDGGTSKSRRRRLVWRHLGWVMLCGAAACGGSPERPDGRLRRLAMIEPPPRGGDYVGGHPIARLALPGVPRKLVIDGAVLYAFLNQWGLATLDVTAPTSPTLVDVQPGTRSSPQAADHMYFTGLAEPDRLLVADRHRRSLAVFSRVDPLRPRPQWETPLPGAGPMDLLAVPEGYYLSCGGDGLYFLPRDFDARTIPIALLHDYDFINEVRPLDDRYLLAADSYHGGVRVLAREAPDRIRLLHAFNTGNFVDALMPFDRWVAVANRNRGLLVLDMSDPAQPYVASQFPSRSQERPTCLAWWTDRRLIVGSNIGCLDVLDLADPARPWWLGRIAVGAQIAALAVAGDLVYVGLAVPPASDALRPTAQLAIYRLEVRRSYP